MSRSGARRAEKLLAVAAIADDGALLRDDGALVRLLELGSFNALAAGAAECERVCSGMQRVAGRLAAGQSLQLYGRARFAGLSGLIAGERQRCSLAAGAAEDAGRDGLASAMRRLGLAAEESLSGQVTATAALEVRFVLVCPWPASGSGGRAHSKAGGATVSREAAAASLGHVEGMAAELQSCGVSARLLGGGEVLNLLHERFCPGWEGLPVSFTDARVLSSDIAAASGAAGADEIAATVCRTSVDLSDRHRLGIGGWLEQVQHVSLPPERTWVGWLLHAMQVPAPWSVSVHVTATDRLRERGAQKRRYKRLYGVNRGVEGRGRPVDADEVEREREAAELVSELGASAGSGIYKMSVYFSVRESSGDAQRLDGLCKEMAGELSMVSDVRLLPGTFAQRDLWRSTLPLGLDVAKRELKYVSANVGDTIAPVGCSCSSPEGIPVGVALPGRTLQRLDPFDSVHPNHLMLVNGVAGAGKTMASIILLCRAMAQGATGSIIDRAGHFAFLASLIPGAASVEMGAGGGAINPWDVADPGQVEPEKVDYLLALHALLLGEHHLARDSYGLSDLESNLLGLAIGEVYARCAATGEQPRELLLAEQLQRRYEVERSEGSAGIAEALRDLTMRLNNYVGDGPYAYLADRPTSIPDDAPLVVFDTRSIPESKAAAALLSICEHVKGRVATTRSGHLAGDGPVHAWAGRSFLVIDEAWHLIERPATGRWFNEFVRRSRHMALWLIAISQQLSDFDCEHGRALLANVTMRLFLRQQPSELARMRESLGISEQAAEAIAGLTTLRGSHAMAYLANGDRGEAAVQIAPGPTEYWIASSDPARDEPVRRAALRRAGGDAWGALGLLANEGWAARRGGEAGGS